MQGKGCEEKRKQGKISLFLGKNYLVFLSALLADAAS